MFISRKEYEELEKNLENYKELFVKYMHKYQDLKAQVTPEIRIRILSDLHKSLIVSSDDYREYCDEFDLNASHRWGLETEFKLSEEEFNFAKGASR